MNQSSPVSTLYPASTQWHAIGERGLTLPWMFGSFEDEYRALRSDAVVLDLSYLLGIRVAGDGAFDLVQQACARDIAYLLPETSILSAVLDGDGGIVDVVTVRRLPDAFLVECSLGCGERTLDHLSVLAGAGTSVEACRQEVILGFEGPFSWKYLEQVLDREVATMPFQGAITVPWEGAELTVVRTGSTAEYGYRLRVPSERARPLWTALAGQSTPCGYRALELAQLEVRHPTPHREAMDGASVVTCGYNWLVDPDKPDYVGAEAVASARVATPSLRTVGFSAGRSPVIAAGQRLLAAGQLDIGSVLWVEEWPDRDGLLGLARVDAAWAVPALPLEVVADGEHSSVTTEAAPYVVPSSWTTTSV